MIFMNPHRPFGKLTNISSKEVSFIKSQLFPGLAFIVLFITCIGVSSTANAQRIAAPHIPEPWFISEAPSIVGMPREKFNTWTRQLSTMDFFDERGMARVTPVPFKTQYVPIAFMQYVADVFRAKTAISLLSAPEDVAGSHSTMALAPGDRVRVLEAYSDVKQPTIYTATKDTYMALPGSDGNERLPIPKGTKLLIVEHPGYECPVFIFTSFVGFKALCYPDPDAFMFRTQKSIARTAYLVETLDGKRAWTRFYKEKQDYAEVLKDWMFCMQDIEPGKFFCKE